MRAKFLITLIVLALFSSCEETEKREVGTEVIDIPTGGDGRIDDTDIPKINFKETIYTAGKITQGEVISHTFEFTNTGGSPLLIANVKGTCGCTVPRSYPQGKLMPGEGGQIEVEFDSDGKTGVQNISIIVSANTIPAATQLLIKTEVVVPDNMK